MATKKLVSFFCSFIGLKARSRIKGSSSSSYLAGAPDIAEDFVKDRTSDSPGGSGHGHALHEGELLLCSVCLSGLKQGEDTLVLPCLHEFHRGCIDGWFKACRKTCPVCRYLVRDHEVKSQVMEVFTEEMVIWFSSFHVAGF